MRYTLEERLLILDKHLCWTHCSSEDDIKIKYNQPMSYNPTFFQWEHFSHLCYTLCTDICKWEAYKFSSFLLDHPMLRVVSQDFKWNTCHNKAHQKILESHLHHKVTMQNHWLQNSPNFTWKWQHNNSKSSKVANYVLQVGIMAKVGLLKTFE